MDSSSRIRIQIDSIEALAEVELDQLVTLINAANADRRGTFSGDRISRQGLAEHYIDCTSVRAFNEGGLIGTVTIRQADDVLWILLLAVTPVRRGSGLGAHLLDVVANHAKSGEIRELRLEAVDTGNLVSYYERLGFTQIGRKRMPAGHWNSTDPFDIVTMSRQLPSG